MKRKLLQVRKMLLVAAGLLVGAMQGVQAESVNATLDHTAGSGWASAVAEGYTVDSANEYFNNDATSGWAGAAFAQFSFEIPDGQTIVSATLTWACNQYNGSTYTSKINYLNAGVTIDYTAFAASEEGTTHLYTNERTPIETTAALQGTKNTGKLHTGLKTDVTEAVKAIVAEGQKYIIFQWTGNNGSAHLKGKGDSENAPTLVIETADASSTTSYTIKFEDADGATLKDPVSVSGVTVGSKVTASAENTVSFKNADGTKKYIYDSGNNEIELQKDAESNVITLVFREAAKVSYVAKATSSDGAVEQEIANGEDFEGETFKIIYPKYLNISGTLYKKDAESDNNKEYSRTVTLPSNTQSETYTFEYAKTDITNVVYFSEAEDIEGMTKETGSNANIRCSNGAGGYSTEVVKATTLEPGKYKVVMCVWGNKTTPATVISASAGGKIIHSAETQGYIDETNSAFELLETADITIQGAVAGKPLDYIYIVKTGEATTSIAAEITTAGWATLYTDYALDFSEVEGLTAYTATCDGETVTLTAVKDVPANTGVVLKGDAKTYEIPVIASSETAKGGLKGSTTEALTYSDEADYDYYMLAFNAAANEVQFTKLIDGSIAAGKAYLELPQATEARVLNVVFAGETTGIAEVEKAGVENGAIYNLSGQRVSKPANGLYIVNGKKVIIK